MVSPQLICLVRKHKWHQGWDNERRVQIWTCERCGRRRVRIGEMDPRKSGWA
jgi:hypothetical protein